MSVEYDGSNEESVYAGVPAAIDVDGAHTLLEVVRIMASADNTWLSFLETETSAAADGASLLRQQLTATLGSLAWAANGSILSAGGPAITDSDGWLLIATTKPAGSSQTRAHSSLIASGTHRHNDAGSVIGAANSITGGTIRIGGNADFANIRVEAAAIFDKALSDAEIEGIATAKTTQSIYDLTPVWLVDGADDLVADYMGNLDRTSVGGTPVHSADTPSGWVNGISGGGTEYTAPEAGTGLIEIAGTATADYVASINYVGPPGSAEPIEVCGNAGIEFTAPGGFAYIGPADNGVFEIGGAAEVSYVLPLAYTASPSGGLVLRGRVREISYTGATTGPMRGTFICKPNGGGGFTCRRVR